MVYCVCTAQVSIDGLLLIIEDVDTQLRQRRLVFAGCSTGGGGGEKALRKNIYLF